MPTPQPTAVPAPTGVPLPASPDPVGIERALARVTHLVGRVRQHERPMAVAGLSLDRAAAAILRHAAGSDPLRPGAPAARLSVETSPATRQPGRLEKDGYVQRVPDPEDRRARRVRLTEAGPTAADRIREVDLRGMRVAPADRPPEDLRLLAELFPRVVGDFVARAEAGIEP
ncbi:MarR family transcriptional regulator [Streptomyces hirsutus]|uniref:MarR family transcriptional regulator n=1 Tax=Streptomyces hirsutus TaxID=35620 RepID=A0ABZ1GEW5_9ACTN|nr:MarR family transcriptional regulator [Streptomyces hirsutus]WSD04677.1 MarR family transcriptional regulator [Streptomyces hirsutus]WTD21933.1 MarR family transcriptional regulator [Streptomyces hirsutus]